MPPFLSSHVCTALEFDSNYSGEENAKWYQERGETMVKLKKQNHVKNIFVYLNSLS